MSDRAARSLTARPFDALPCGYAPRVLHRGRYDDRLFVGSKDGSISEVVHRKDGYTSRFLLRGPDSGVRALSEWKKGVLWVGRRDGRVELIDLKRKSEPMTLPGLPAQDSVRALGWVDEERRFLSFQKAGTWVLKTRDDRFPLSVDGKALCSVLFVVPLEGRDGRLFLTLDTLGKVFLWNGGEDGAARPVNPWPGGQKPGFVNDFSVLWTSRRREHARGVLVASDLGVHLIYPANGRNGIACHQLNLPGLGAVCMAVTYVEPERQDVSYLWTTDSRGDDYLFIAEKGADAAKTGFRPSGYFQAGSQSMLATSWYREKESCLILCQVRRNDQIVLTEYRDVAAVRSDRKAQRARQLLTDGDAQEIGRFWKGQEPAAWPPYAQLSELFEHLAERTSTLGVLLEFLGNPSALPAWSLLEALPGEKERRTAVQLWTLSLMGVINRTGGKLKESQKESAYLGIIHWLGQLREQALSSPGLQDLANELETSIRMVRKWGLFGEANARRDNLIRPLNALRRQRRGDQSRDDQQLERLTYETLLFERGVALRAEYRKGALPGRNAWALSGATLWGRYHFAVSWHWGSVEVYEVREPGEEPKFERLGPRPPAGFEEPATSQYGHSRAILLGKLSVGGHERAYLLTAPALPHDPKARESLSIRELQPGADPASGTHRSIDLPKGESLYSLLDLGSGWILAGLRGNGGRALCVVGQVVEDADGALTIKELIPYRDHPGTEPRSDSVDRSRNRVWCLARIEPPSAGSRHEALLGCEDGSIYRLKIHPDGPRKSEWALVARMSSAVKALVCRRVGKDSLLRIISGGSNGDIIAWQELTDGRNYASLWAAGEGEQIAGLHLLEIVETDRSLSPMVLAITQDERFVLFSDCDVVADLEFGRRPKRIPVPGCRHGTFQRLRQERASAFATWLVPGDAAVLKPEEAGSETGRVAAVLTASKHGVLRLLSLHYPHFQSTRKVKFESILKDWRNIVQGDHQVRLVHAAYRTAPSLELILVRWLLDPAWPVHAAPWSSDSLEPWMLPRNLRPLLKLGLAWTASHGAPAPQRRIHLADTYSYLLAALREAFRLSDLLLYEEICEVALQRANWDLFTAAQEPEKPRSVSAARVYLQIFKAIEESLQQWRGSVNREESLARMNVARNLVDGDTAFYLAAAVTGKSNVRHFRTALARRIRGIRDLILKGDSTSTIEALRAANLSLLRLCKRLVDLRKTRPKAELEWTEGFEPYFSELAAAAVRALRSSFKVGDVVEHGYARTFALAVCACPSAALRIATRLTEFRLISNPDAEDDLSQLILRQFDILEQIGIPVHPDAQALFQIGARPPQQRLDPLQHPWLLDKGCGRTDDAPHVEDPPAHAWQDFGRENSSDLACLWRVYGLVNWFSRLEQIFSRQPEALAKAWNELSELFDRFCDEVVKGLYRHTFLFWCGAVQRFVGTVLERAPVEWEKTGEDDCRKLLRELLEEVKAGTAGDPLQPRIVLLSRKVAEWAAETRGHLDRRYQDQEIFQPEYSIFREILARLERAARGFRHSAAVRMNLVQGVLGHHLLEDLDEHLLELREIAQVLDPLLVRQYRQANPIDDPNSSIAQRFALYLMTRSSRAESLPENLRTLFSLLSQPGSEGESARTLGELLGQFASDWNVDFGSGGKKHPIENEVLRHLDLVLKELSLNARKHPRPGRRSPVQATVRALPDLRAQIEIRFRFPTTEEERTELRELRSSGAATEARGNLARLDLLKTAGLQNPIAPRPDRVVASSGMGLYVANFAAAIVHWELGIVRVRSVGTRGECVFTLTELEPLEG